MQRSIYAFFPPHHHHHRTTIITIIIYHYLLCAVGTISFSLISTTGQIERYDTQPCCPE